MTLFHKALSVLAFSVCFLGLQAQEKYEKESRIKITAVPQAAKDFIQQIDFNCKVKWYLEEGLERYSYEAKTKFKKAKFSIEFDRQGQFEDAEINIKLKHIPKTSRDSILQYLSIHFDLHKIEKIQLQLIGTVDTVQEMIRNWSFKKMPQGQFELIVKTRLNRDYQLQEFLFDAKGRFIKSSKIIQENTFHLEF